MPNVSYWLESAAWFLGFMGVFWILSRRFAAADRGPLLPKGAISADMAYWFVFPLLYGLMQTAWLNLGLGALFGGDQDKILTFFATGVPALRALPLWLQALLVLLISDVMLYWSHRWFHKGRLWRFHAIHHAPKQVDWLTCVRFHPLNVAFYTTLVNALVIMMGFSPQTLVFLAPFNIIWSALVHANLNWDFGPFRMWIASPVFHRWHHSDQPEAIDKNFAATFPFIDWLFGTLYFPKGEQPKSFGTPHDPVPENLLGQMVYPFAPSWFEKPKSAAPHTGLSPVMKKEVSS